MKKVITVFIFLILSISSFSRGNNIQKYQTLDIGEITISTIDKKPITGTVIDEKDREYYKNGKPHGKWITFYSNKKIKSIENWKKQANTLHTLTL